MKRLTVLLLALVFLLTSCSGILPAPPDSGRGKDASSQEEREDRKSKRKKDKEEGGGSTSGAAGSNPWSFGSSGNSAPAESYDFFSQLPSSFYFSSGAGAWGTELSIKPDGSFSGGYHDADMGVIGPGYPGGTVYVSGFNGRLSAPVQINDYTWSATVLELNLDVPPGEQKIEDEILWIYTEPYGLDDVEELYIYTPEAPVEELPEEFLDWVIWYAPKSGPLGFYGLYNVNAQQGYAGED